MKNHVHHHSSEDARLFVAAQVRRRSSLEGASAGKRPRCSASKQAKLRKEAEDQTIEAAREIMRANVAKALEGSLAHTKWLFSLVEQTNARSKDVSAEGKSLAAHLLRALGEDESGK